MLNTITPGILNLNSFSPKQDIITGTNHRSIAIGDLDGNGRVDLALTNQNADSVSLLRNTTNNQNLESINFSSKIDFKTNLTPFSVAIGDLDNDGKPDLVVANFYSSNISIFRNIETILPSYLGNFYVNKVNKTALIQLTTLTETNSDYIEIQHSKDGNKFMALEKLTAKVNSINLSSYSFTHSNPFDGINYYRLKLVDLNGKFSYSEIRRVDFTSKENELIVYPNPVKAGNLNIDYGEEIKDKIPYFITTLDGRLVQEGYIINRQQTINISNVIQKIYVLEIRNKKAILLVKD